MSRKQKKELIKIGISAALFLAGILLSLLFPSSVFTRILSLIFQIAAYLIVGLEVLMDAFSGIRNGQLFDENFLMAVATIGALIIGEYHEC